MVSDSAFRFYLTWYKLWTKSCTSRILYAMSKLGSSLLVVKVFNKLLAILRFQISRLLPRLPPLHHLHPWKQGHKVTAVSSTVKGHSPFRALFDVLHLRFWGEKCRKSIAYDLVSWTCCFALYLSISCLFNTFFICSFFLVLKLFLPHGTWTECLSIRT